jgi:hypothetical protein
LHTVQSIANLEISNSQIHRSDLLRSHDIRLPHYVTVSRWLPLIADTPLNLPDGTFLTSDFKTIGGASAFEIIRRAYIRKLHDRTSYYNIPIERVFLVIETFHAIAEEFKDAKAEGQLSQVLQQLKKIQEVVKGRTESSLASIELTTDDTVELRDMIRKIDCEHMDYDRDVWRLRLQEKIEGE